MAQWSGGTPTDVTEMESRFLRLTNRPKGAFGRFVAMLSSRWRTRRLDDLLGHIAEWPNRPEGLPDAGDAARRRWERSWHHWRALATAKQLLGARTQSSAAAAELEPASVTTDDMTQAHERLKTAALAALLAVADGQHAEISQTQRTRLAELRGAAENFGTAAAGKALKQNISLLMEMAPIWATTCLSLGSALPLEPGMFDLVVIDEASQCDIPAIVPALFRAKRAVIAGDPNQLTHITKLKVIRERELLRRHGLTETGMQRFSFKMNSAYDMASSAPQLADGPTFLGRHFRCHPDIADYASQVFYRGEMTVCTEGRRWSVPAGAKPGVHWTHVSGPIVSPGSSADSPSERLAIVKELRRLAESGYRGTVGVVTPFKRQRDRLMDEINRALDPSFLESARLVVGTAHALQGDERDVVLMSLCAGPELKPGAAGFISKNRNLFNVAITRAKAMLHIFGNIEWARERGPDFIARLARKEARTAPEEAVAKRYESVWERRFDEALERAGVRTISQYPVAGRRLDLAVLQGDLRLDIEVDGERYHRLPSGHRLDDDIWRDHQLRSIGWTVMRFWVYELREDMEACVSRVTKALRPADGATA